MKIYYTDGYILQ